MNGIQLLAQLPNGKKIYRVRGHIFEVPQPYHLTKSIGVGAYGIVCAAQTEDSSRKVAIKKIPRAMEDLREGKRILREMEIMTTLEHPNLIRLHHFLRPPSRDTFNDIYLVMDLYDTDLHRIIQSHQKLTLEHHQYLMVQAFRGLHYLHSAKVMHRDLKPSNLLVNANCALVICDFGLARDDQLNPSTDLTQYVVTRWYRPPEVLGMGSKQYTSAVDVWSLGLIFAELLLGRTLLPGTDYIKQLLLITNLLGTPSTEEMEFLSAEVRTFLAAQPRRESRPFHELFPMATAEACDLLSKLLVFHPAKRINARVVIEHPYFADFRDPELEKAASQPFVSVHNREYTTESLRKAFWELIVRCSRVDVTGVEKELPKLSGGKVS